MSRATAPNRGVSAPSSPTQTALETRCVAPHLALAVVVGLIVSTVPVAGQITWSPSGSAPGARTRHAMAYHLTAQRTVLFGGSARFSGMYDDTWTWDGASWARVAAPAVPSRREDAAMAFHAPTGRIVLFGGFDGRTLGDTWLFDGVRWDLATPRTTPGPRRDPALAADAARGTLILFGGLLPSGAPSDETWTWDGVRWQRRVTATVPPARQGHAMAWDRNGAVVMFGGEAGGVPLGDTWLWNGTDWRPAGPSRQPAARAEHTMTTDASGQVVLQGGWGTTSVDDTWVWDGADWQPLVGAQPTSAFERTAAFDVARGAHVLFGGLIGRLHARDTWLLPSGRSDWTTPGAGALPSERFQLAMAWDEARRQTVLFGGTGGTAGSPVEHADTWTLDGGTWQRHVGGAAPAARAQSAMAFDRARGTVILFGGLGVGNGVRYGDTWEWNGSNWNQLAPSVSPPARFGHAMATDPWTGTPLLFGGEGTVPFVRLADTWAFRNGTWVALAAGPAARRNARLSETVGGLVLFGGLDDQNFRLDDTWVYESTAGRWVQKFPASSPPARTDHAMAFDAQRGKAVLHSGQTFNLLFADQWEWDGFDWAQASPVPLPAARIGAGMVYDSYRGATVLAMGYAPGPTGGYVTDTWLGAGLPITFGTFGRGCAGMFGAPFLGSGTFGPWLGWGFQIRIDNLPGNVATALSLGFDTFSFAGLPLPLDLRVIGFPDCWWLIDPVTNIPPVATLGNTAYYSISVPNESRLIGILLYSQGAVLDATAPGGLTVSNASVGRLGAR